MAPRWQQRRQPGTNGSSIAPTSVAVVPAWRQHGRVAVTAGPGGGRRQLAPVLRPAWALVTWRAARRFMVAGGQPALHMVTGGQCGRGQLSHSSGLPARLPATAGSFGGSSPPQGPVLAGSARCSATSASHIWPAAGAAATPGLAVRMRVYLYFRCPLFLLLRRCAPSCMCARRAVRNLMFVLHAGGSDEEGFSRGGRRFAGSTLHLHCWAALAGEYQARRASWEWEEAAVVSKSPRCCEAPLGQLCCTHKRRNTSFSNSVKQSS